MRILHFGVGWYDDTIFSLLKGFKNLGHEVKTCDVVSLKENPEEAITNFRPDIVMTIGMWFEQFDAQSLWAIIKRHGIPHIYWAIEDPTFFDIYSTVHLDEYDFIFTISESCIEKYAQRGKPAAYLPFSCNPEVHKRVAPVREFRNDIVVLANNYVVIPRLGKYEEIDPSLCEFRNKCYHDLIEPLIKNGYDIKIYGNRWHDERLGIPAQYRGGWIKHSLIPAVYSSAKIVITVQWDYEGHVSYKTYEALGCGCMQIAAYTPLQKKYFKHGEHLIYSRRPEETIKYVDYYLHSEEEREALAARGQAEAYLNHNCTQRAADALEILGRHGIVPAT